MPPTSSAIQISDSLKECGRASIIPACTTVCFIALLLVFYALALWDRWIALRSRESHQLQVRLNSRVQSRLYGAVGESSSSNPFARDSDPSAPEQPNYEGDNNHLKAPLIKIHPPDRSEISVPEREFP
ncbi:hypothetical protein R3P38DRAFT_1096274 [Favolaschia claudopus]|uniref:Uncharacterized protein n=1 Tax=Favolaschia claudopus TaxID=2862362 RepID=A0AAW0BAQ1_9AGAR